MTDDTAVPRHDVLTAVAAAFGLGELNGPGAYVDGGVSARVFKVSTSTGDWALRRLLGKPDLAGLETQARLQEAARTAGVVTPRAMRTAPGGFVAMVKDVHWQASEWVAVSRDTAELVERDRLEQVGEVLAAIHGLRLAAPHDVTPWLTTPPSAAEWEAVRGLVRESGPHWAAQFEELYPEVLRLAEFAGSGLREQAVLSHCDLGPANVGVAGDHLVVFDWERAGAIPPVQELGYVLIHWAGLADPAAIVPPIVAGYRRRSDDHVAVGPEMFVCAANANLNFLRSAIHAANGPRVAAMLRDFATLDSLDALAELATGR